MDIHEQDLEYFLDKFKQACLSKNAALIEKSHRQLSLIIDATATYCFEKLKQ